MESTKKQF